MKKTLILLLLLPLIIVSCKSNEEKAAELIKKELSKTLLDFDSYSPIETIVTEAKQSVYTDTTFWTKANITFYTVNLAADYIEKANEAKEHMDIWGAPTRYSSSHSDNKYYKYKEEWEENMEKATTSYELFKVMAKELKDTLQTVDTEKIVGWEVKHRFRCKTKGGYSTIGDYRYVMDEDFKKVLIHEDMDDDDSKDIRDMIKFVIDGGFEQ